MAYGVPARDRALTSTGCIPTRYDRACSTRSRRPDGAAAARAARAGGRGRSTELLKGRADSGRPRLLRPGPRGMGGRLGVAGRLARRPVPPRRWPPSSAAAIRSAGPGRRAAAGRPSSVEARRAWPSFTERFQAAELDLEAAARLDPEDPTPVGAAPPVRPRPPGFPGDAAVALEGAHRRHRESRLAHYAMLGVLAWKWGGSRRRCSPSRVRRRGRAAGQLAARPRRLGPHRALAGLRAGEQRLRAPRLSLERGGKDRGGGGLGPPVRWPAPAVAPLRGGGPEHVRLLLLERTRTREGAGGAGRPRRPGHEVALGLRRRYGEGGGGATEECLGSRDPTLVDELYKLREEAMRVAGRIIASPWTTPRRAWPRWTSSSRRSSGPSPRKKTTLNASRQRRARRNIRRLRRRSRPAAPRRDMGEEDRRRQKGGYALLVGDRYGFPLLACAIAMRRERPEPVTGYVRQWFAPGPAATGLPAGAPPARTCSSSSRRDHAGVRRAGGGRRGEAAR